MLFSSKLFSGLVIYDGIHSNPTQSEVRMSPQILRILIAGALFVHGVGHTLGFWMPARACALQFVAATGGWIRSCFPPRPCFILENVANVQHNWSIEHEHHCAYNSALVTLAANQHVREIEG
jgi:hypothetical protein